MKPIWKLIMIAIASGVVISLTALSLGAADTGFYLDLTGVHVTKHGESNLITELNIGDVTDIDIDGDFSDVEFLSADEFGIEIYGDSKDWDWKLENKALKVRQKNSQKLFITGFNFSPESNYLRIYVPKDAELGEVLIKVGSGSVNVGDFVADHVEIHNSFGKTDIYDIISDRVKVTMNSGKFTGSDLTAESMDYKSNFGGGYLESSSIVNFNADVSSGNFELQDCSIDDIRIKDNFGSINASDISTQKANINVSSGSVNLDGELLGETTINSDFGAVTLSTTKAKEDYSYNIDATFGKITVDNDSMGSNTSIQSKSTSENHLKIKASSGNIDVSFGK